MNPTRTGQEHHPLNERAGQSTQQGHGGAILPIRTGRADFQIAKFPDCHTCRFPGFQTAKYPHFQIPQCHQIPIFSLNFQLSPTTFQISHLPNLPNYELLNLSFTPNSPSPILGSLSRPVLLGLIVPPCPSGVGGSALSLLGWLSRPSLVWFIVPPRRSWVGGPALCVLG